MEQTQTMAEFIAAHGITMEACPAASNPNMSDTMPGGSHWLCVLRRTDRAGYSMSVPYSQGAAHRRWKKDAAKLASYSAGLIQREIADIKPGVRVQQSYLSAPHTLHKEALLKNYSEPTPPDLANVLDCLASDASSYDNARNFDDWCSAFGMDTDSRKAEATYRVCGEQAKALRHFLGDEAYKTLLFKIERL